MKARVISELYYYIKINETDTTANISDIYRTSNTLPRDGKTRLLFRDPVLVIVLDNSVSLHGTPRFSRYCALLPWWANYWKMISVEWHYCRRNKSAPDILDPPYSIFTWISNNVLKFFEFVKKRFLEDSEHNLSLMLLILIFIKATLASKLNFRWKIHSSLKTPIKHCCHANIRTQCRITIEILHD